MTQPLLRPDAPCSTSLGLLVRAIRAAPLSPRQTTVLAALLVEHPAFEPPEPPVSYVAIASALGVSLDTVKTHLRRSRARDPELYQRVMTVRRGQFAAYHAAVAGARRERSRQWGKRRWAARYRSEHGAWPWERFVRDAPGVTRVG